jgi:hypothetical protein
MPRLFLGLRYVVSLPERPAQRLFRPPHKATGQARLHPAPFGSNDQ